MNLPATQRDLIEVTRRRLELRYAYWPGDWESFKAMLRNEGSDVELLALELSPAEFKGRAELRAERLARWQENRLGAWLEKLDALTEAEKFSEDAGGMVADNPTRLGALRLLIDRTLGQAREVPPPAPQSKLAKDLGDSLKRADDLREALRQRGVEAVVEVERRLELGKGSS